LAVYLHITYLYFQAPQLPEIIIIVIVILLQLGVHPVAVDLTLITQGNWTIHEGNNTKQGTQNDISHREELLCH
jgi:hypothetical protein